MVSQKEPDCDATLQKRVAALERQNRRFKQASILILLTTMAALLMGQAAPTRVLEAQDFVLRDASGRIRARLGLWMAEPSLALYDSLGHPRVLIDGTEPAVHLSDANAIPRLSMMVTSFGASFSVSDTGGRVRADLGTRDSQNAATVSFYDEKATGRAAIGLVANAPVITLQDASGKPIWTSPGSTSAADEMTSVGRRPRVFIETWDVTQTFKPQVSESFDEMQAFVQRCPQAAAVIKQQEADYVLRLEHHYVYQGTGFYQYAVFDGTGAAIGTASNLQLLPAADSSCKGILTNWAAKGR
jgi:hypothetical protein